MIRHILACAVAVLTLEAYVGTNPVCAARISVLGQQDFADGAIVQDADWFAAQANEAPPFSVLHVTPNAIQFTHTGLDSGAAGTLSISLWDLDSDQFGNQITAFSLDGIAQPIAPFDGYQSDLRVLIFHFPVAASYFDDGILSVSLTIGDPPVENNVGIDFTSVRLVPEPSTIALAWTCVALLALTGLRQRGRRRSRKRLSRSELR